MKEVITETFKLSFDGRILTSELMGDVEIDIDQAESIYQASLKITQEQKYLSLVLTSPNASVSIEAQKKSITKEKYKNTIAQAIVIHSLAQRILGNFMIQFIKFPCPCRLFTSKEEAISWLNENREDRKRKTDKFESV